MEFRILSISTFLLLAAVLNHATLPSEEYWETALPNIPMPKFLRELLHPDFGNEMGTYGSGKQVGNSEHLFGPNPYNYPTTYDQLHPFYYSYDAGEDQLHPFLYGNNAPDHQLDPLRYNHDAAEYKHYDNPTISLFFLEKDLHTKTKMKLRFTWTTPGATFLQHQKAEAIPFSSEKFPEILKKFSFNPGSKEASAIHNTITACEALPYEGEEKSCVKSLESMVDFSTSKLGRNVRVLSTEVTSEDSQAQEYHIESVKKIEGAHHVVCHNLIYPYALFNCHATHTKRIYVVPLVGVDGKKVKAIALCHTNTSWKLKHLAFQVKVKPGTPICHFLPEDHIVWVSK